MKALAAFFTFAVLAGIAPLRPLSAPSLPGAAVSPGALPGDWPETLVATNWIPLSLGERETRFARDFPGRIGVFATPDGRTVIVRHVLEPTRKLHPAADCLRALGYDIHPGAIQRDAAGDDWNTFQAARASERLQVRERLLGADGRHWTDLSAWYWSAALGRASGPWWAVTEITPLPGPVAR